MIKGLTFKVSKRILIKGKYTNNKLVNWFQLNSKMERNTSIHFAYLDEPQAFSQRRFRIIISLIRIIFYRCKYAMLSELFLIWNYTASKTLNTNKRLSLRRFAPFWIKMLCNLSWMNDIRIRISGTSTTGSLLLLDIFPFSIEKINKDCSCHGL